MSRLELVRDLLDRALREPPRSRLAFVRAHCEDRPSVAAEVESLLEAHESAAAFLSRPAAHALVRHDLKPGARVGAYEVKSVMGAGGSATVYEAIQDRPQRRVALKVLHTGLHAVDEAEVLGRLRHPGIAHIYEAGAFEGLPYFAMEFVEGARTLTRFVAEEAPATGARLALLCRVADAVHYAHVKGIVHQDLKPGNILVAEDGTPKVIDFGIARIEKSATAPLAGTPAYMSPEQCMPKGEVDARSDVYSLGVVLCELLTGRLPHDVDRVPLPEALRRIREEEPHIALRGDLGAIARRALAKDPDARYSSAAALAEDIRRVRTHRPVEARAGGALYHLGKLARRHIVACAGLGAVLAVSVSAALVTGRLAIERDQARQRAEFQTYVASVAAAAAALNGSDVNSAREHLERAPVEHRGWEWRHLDAMLSARAREVACSVATGAVGDRLVAGAVLEGTARRVRVWDGETLEEVLTFPCDTDVLALAIAPGDAAIAVGRIDGVIELRSPRDGGMLRAWRSHDGHVIVLRYGDGVLASGGRDGRARVWDVAAGTLLADLPHPERVIGLALDGERLVTGVRNGTIHVWNWRSGSRERVLRGHGGSVEAVALHGDLLVSASRDETVRLWDVGTGEALAMFRGHSDNVRDVAFSPDGSSFATASYDRSVRIWKRHGQTGVLLGHTRSLYGVAWTGGRLVSFGEDRVRVWDMNAPRAYVVLRSHEDHVRGVAVDPDALWIASVSYDRTLCFWDVAEQRLLQRVELGEGQMVDIAPFGGGVAVAQTGRPTRVWSPGGKVVRTLPPAARLATDGGDLYGADPTLWRARGDGAPETLSAERLPSVHSLAARGGRVAIGCRDGRLLLRSAGDQAESAPGDGARFELAFDPEGKTLAVGLVDGGLLLLDPESLKVIRCLEGHPDYLHALAFSDDGKRLATCGGRGVSIWDPARGIRMLRIDLNTGATQCLAWTGPLLVAGGGVWDVPGEIHVWTTR